MLDSYSRRHFIKENKDYDTTTVCEYTTKYLEKYGYDRAKEEMQEVAGITIYPSAYFCPLNYATGILNITENTRSIHQFAATWHSKIELIIERIEQSKNGKNSAEYKMRRVVSFPFRVINKVERMGVCNTFFFATGKMRTHMKKQI